MLCGVDLSVWNSDIPTSFGQFQIHKITEGATIVDERFEQWWTQRKIGNNLNGVYHFMTSENADQQFQFFKDALITYDAFNNMIIADWEDTVSDYDADGDILREWCEAVINDIGAQPVIYCDMYNATRLTAGINDEYFMNNVSWWIADYDSKLPLNRYGFNQSITPVLRQFTSSPICDMDIFFGSEGGFREFMSNNYSKI